MTEVKLHGVLLSPYVYRVIWALKLKGVPYEFVAEDLSNKSDLLLKYNPVYKKIPVLVHGEKPVSESMVILEYIEEMWPQNPSLMPNDPYDRALARFWIKFIEDKIVAILGLFRSITGQELENATKELLEILQTLEEHGLGEKFFFNGDNIGLVDIAFGSMLFSMQVIGDVVGVKPFESHKFPSLHAWFENFKQIPVIEENFPNRDEYFVYIKRRREELLASA
ncbi:glutathione transferase GST 23 [Citrus sinensis]|uniref:Glutathione transferase GST 23 n=1 Tax=Citrus sinensis TaxID=2711 RepID=A0ACB8I4P2_CITSI|nr:glutathione transferase GST 23 [Citrus sinensis]